MFERSTKTRQTLDLLGNVYRNSKWTDLKVQNIKGAHLSNFTKINVFFLTFSVITYIMLFRFELSSLVSISTSIGYWASYARDSFTYMLSVAAIYLFTLYLYFSKLLSSLISSKFNDTNTIYSYEASLNLRSQKDLNFKPSIVFSSPIGKNLTSEVVLLKELFYLKHLLDSKINASLHSTRVMPNIITDEAFLLLEGSQLETKSQLSNPLYKLECFYFDANSYSEKFIKANLSDLELSKSSKDAHTSLLLENSVKSTLSLANSSRWLIKMSPLSENLALNNSYATNLKYSLGSSSINSQSTNNSIWLSNTENSTSNVLPGKNLAFLDNFESSRLWNQKRAFFTLLPKLSLTEQKEMLDVDNQNFNSQYNYGFLLSGLNQNYPGLKNMFLADVPTNLVKLDTEGVNFNHISNPTLNLWNNLDNYFSTSLCSTNSLDKKQSYYNYSSDSNIYKGI